MTSISYLVENIATYYRQFQKVHLGFNFNHLGWNFRHPGWNCITLGTGRRTLGPTGVGHTGSSARTTPRGALDPHRAGGPQGGQKGHKPGGDIGGGG